MFETYSAMKRNVRYGLKAAFRLVCTCSATQFTNAVDVNASIMNL
jgi:hypothetical protein